MYNGMYRFTLVLKLPGSDDIRKKNLSSLFHVLLASETLESIAASLGVAYQSVMRWRDGKVLIIGNNRAKLIEVLGVEESTFQQFLDGAIALQDFLNRRGEVRSQVKAGACIKRQRLKAQIDKVISERKELGLNEAIAALVPLVKKASPPELIAGGYALVMLNTEIMRSLETKIKSESPAVELIEKDSHTRANVAMHTASIYKNMQNSQEWPETFPELIQLWMDEAGLSQKQFEALVKSQTNGRVSAEDLRQIQNNERSANLTEFAAIFQVLGLERFPEAQALSIKQLTDFYGIVDAPDNNSPSLQANDSLNSD